MMDYGDSLRTVLIRKINKAERDLYQLKLDYCRFVFGLSHRSRVTADQSCYQIKSVDLDSMTRTESGDWCKPNVAGILLNSELQPLGGEVIQLGNSWESMR
ncbi:hypothetical protein [Oleiphilus messinensis]|nr:hypothetical protein [Oleiphilus messinensis]